MLSSQAELIYNKNRGRDTKKLRKTYRTYKTY